MKLTESMIAEIKDYITSNEVDYEYEKVGVRVQAEPFELGEVGHVSHIWVDGEDTGEELNGLCVCDINSLRANEYCGEHVAIIAGNDYEYGEDVGEIILADPTCVYILK